MSLNVQVEVIQLEVSVETPPSIEVTVSDAVELDVTYGAPAEVDVTVVTPPALEVTLERTGPKGDKGDKGDTGAEPYLHTQNAPATIWTVTHNLGRRPVAVAVYDTAETLLLGSFEYVSDDQIKLHFSVPFSGRAEVL